MAREYDPDDLWGWYFTPGPRMVITIPILLFFGLGTLWYFLLVPLVWIDLFLWNFLFFFFVGLAASWLVGAISGIIASLAFILLPHIWDGWNTSSFVKLPAWMLLASVSIFVPGFTSGFGLSLLQWLGMPMRATGWWLIIHWSF